MLQSGRRTSVISPCDLKEHRDLFSFLYLAAEEEEEVALANETRWSCLSSWRGKQQRSVASVTRLWNDKTAWSQLGYPDTLETALCPGWQGTKFSVLVLIRPVSVVWQSVSWNTDSRLKISHSLSGVFCVLQPGEDERRRAIICWDWRLSNSRPDIMLHSHFPFVVWKLLHNSLVKATLPHSLLHLFKHYPHRKTDAVYLVACHLRSNSVTLNKVEFA